MCAYKTYVLGQTFMSVVGMFERSYDETLATLPKEERDKLNQSSQFRPPSKQNIVDWFIYEHRKRQHFYESSMESTSKTTHISLDHTFFTRYV